MTLRELIDQVTDFDSESPALDYKIQIQSYGESNFNPSVENVTINEQAKQIIIKQSRNKWCKSDQIKDAGFEAFCQEESER